MKKKNEFILTALDELVDKKTVSKIVYNHLEDKDLEKATKLVQKFNISIYDLKSKLQKKDSNQFYNIKDSFLISLFGEKEFLNFQISNIKEATNISHILGFTCLSYILAGLITMTPFIILKLGFINFFVINVPISIIFSITFFLYQKNKSYKLENKIKNLLE